MTFTRTTLVILATALATGCGADATTERRTADAAAPPAASARPEPRNPCDLVPKAELEAILKAPLGPGELSGKKCVYGSAGSPLRTVEIEIDWTDGRESMAAWRDGVEMVDSATRRDTGQSGVSSTNLAGLGDEAIFTLAGFMPFLNVRKGDVAFQISAFGAAEAELVAIARTVAQRLP